MAVEDVSRGNPKLPQSEFLDSGALPVVDQGQKYIAGYTNDTALKCRAEGPLVIFGDHTRSIKYVDFPFVIGADGVKVLRIREGWDTKYVYHYLRSTDVPSAGYSRHFKFLKEFQVPRPSLREQRRIAAILDHADALRAKRRQVLAHLDSLTQSIFHDMFGDPGNWSSRWPMGVIGDMAESVQYGTSAKAAATGEWPILRMGNVTDHGRLDLTDLKYIDLMPSEIPKYAARRGDLLFNRTNSKEKVGKAAVVHTDQPLAIAGYLVRVRFKPEHSPDFVSAYLASPHGVAVRQRLAKAAVNQANINATELRQISTALPPSHLQHHFAAHVASVEAQRTTIERALAADDELFASLQSRAFRGEL